MKLSDLAALAALSAPKEDTPANRKLGYDGKTVQLRISLDSKSRRGKTVTSISGFQSRPEELETLAQQLKKLCGAGGSVGDNVIELQGDHQDKVRKRLTELGYSIRK